MANGPSVCRRSVSGMLVGLALVATACGGDGEGTASREESTVTGGHATLRFSGAVAGSVDQDTEVACFPPSEEGQPFTVSVDADAGLPVGHTELSALDFSIPDYDGAKAYDLRTERDTEESFDADQYIALFEDRPDDPFVWGHGGASGTITVDEGGESGSLALRGWRNSAGDRLDVEGTFRCGRRAER